MATKKQIQEVEVLSKLVKAYNTIIEMSSELRYAKEQIRLNKAALKSLEAKTTDGELVNVLVKTNKYKDKACWSFWPPYTTALQKARRQCAECSSQECKRRVPQKNS